MITPRRLRIDTSTHCQLKCPACPNKSLGETDVGKGFIDLDDYKRLLDNIKRIEIGNWGEPFLHPKMSELFELSQNIKVGILSNLNSIKDDVIESLVRFKVDKIVVSLDGASQTTYEQYRVNGNFEQVLRNVEKINTMKRRFKSRFPVLVWQFLAFGFNEHEIQKAKQMARFLNMEWSMALPTEMDFRKGDYACDLSPIMDKDLVRNELGFATLDEQKEAWGAFRDFGVCLNLWDEPSINWDGKNLGCCTSLKEFGGNAFEDFVGSMNTETMNYARDMVRGRVPAKGGIPCSDCLAYKMMERDGTWLTRD